MNQILKTEENLKTKAHTFIIERQARIEIEYTQAKYGEQ